MLRPQVKAQTHPPHRPLPLLILYLNQTFYTQGPSMSGELVGTSFLCSFRELNMKETNPPLPTSSVPPQRGGASGEQRPDTAAGQARIYARDKTGNRKETTQSPTLPDVTEPLLIFLDEREKNNLNNIRCSIGGRGRGVKRRRRSRLVVDLTLSGNHSCPFTWKCLLARCCF